MRDLGFVFGRGGHSSGKNANALGKSDTLQSIVSTQPSSQSQPSAPSAKRQSSPDHRRRDDSRGNDHGPPAKRQRPGSPARGHDRERWDGAGRKRHGSPPQWDRDREHDGPRRRYDKERPEDDGVVLPPILPWFIGQLPPPSAFEGMFLDMYACAMLKHLHRSSVSY